MYYILSSDLSKGSEDAILETNGDELPSFENGLEFENAYDKEVIRLELSKNIIPGNLGDRMHILGFYALVVSTKAKDLFEIFGVDNIEYIPLEIIAQPIEPVEFPPSRILFIKIKHKPKPVEPVDYSGYFAANIVGLCDCVDKEHSDIEYFGDSEEIDHIHRIAFDESRIPPELRIFRLKHYTDLIVVHDSLVEAIQEAGLTGFNFVRPEDFTEDIGLGAEEEIY